MEEKCKVCGCTDYKACEGGCYWVAEELCNKCAEKLIEEIKKLKEKLKKIEKYIEVSKEQITTKYSNEIPKEILLTHINIILNKIKGDD